MAYQVLARKWRPQDFSSVVGQEPIVTALRNALTEGRIAQAYLFSGIRGVGKTSVARILAKSLNCEKGPAADPCNACVACREITRGSDLDVLEIDAATYSKVEQVRELTESLKYGPAKDRYKVVVIDEVHRLSRQAFDALLKIVEEPPEHLVFIFATTEAEAVPVTILSRCQEFRFRRVPSRILAEHLRTVAESEEIEVGDTALRLLARAGDGSVRDAVALLDQLATFGSGKISDEEAVRILGGVDHAIFQRLLGAVLASDSATVAGVVREVEAQGWDPRHVYGEFLAYCRDALHLALGGAAGDVDLPEEEARTLSAAVEKSGYENLLRLLHQLLASESAVRRSEVGGLALEIAWLRAAELPKLVRIEEILAGGPPPAAGGESGGGPRGGPESGPRRKSPGEGAQRAPTLFDRDTSRGRAAAAAPAVPELPPEPPRPVAAAASSGQAAVAEQVRPEAKARSAETVPAPNDPLAAFLDQVSRRRQPLAAHLAEADRLAFEEGQLCIYAPPGDTWLPTALQRRSNREVLEQALAAVWGPDARWSLGESRSAPAAASEEPAPAMEKALADPRVQAVLDIFGGKIESVEKR